MKGSGTGQGDLGGGGEGSGTGQGGYGLGPGNGSGGGGGTGNEGPPKGGSGNGGSGNGGMGVPRPRSAENPDPVYPSEARRKGYQGVVMLRVEVLTSGLVGRIEVKKSSGYEVLDQSALAAVKKWKFVPAKKEDIAVSVWVSIPIKFHLL